MKGDDCDASPGLSSGGGSASGGQDFHRRLDPLLQILKLLIDCDAQCLEYTGREMNLSSSICKRYRFTNNFNELESPSYRRRSSRLDDCVSNASIKSLLPILLENIRELLLRPSIQNIRCCFALGLRLLAVGCVVSHVQRLISLKAESSARFLNLPA